MSDPDKSESAKRDAIEWDMERSFGERLAFKVGKSTLQERLKAIQVFVGGLAALSEMTGMSPSGVKGWVGARASEPAITSMGRLSRETGISLDYIASGAPATLEDFEVEICRLDNRSKEKMPQSGFVREFFDYVESVKRSMKSEFMQGLDAEENEHLSGFVSVPMLDVKASAGAGSVAVMDGSAESDTVAFRETWLRSLGLTPGATHAMFAVGDSMEPTIRDGDLLLVDRSVRRARDNGIYVVVFGDLVLVKRVLVRRDGSVVLRSDNKDLFDEETVRAEELDQLRIEGRVRWFGRPL